MTAGLIITMIIAVPLILFPVAFVWYLNIGGLIGLIREHRKEPATEKQKAKAVAGPHA